MVKTTPMRGASNAWDLETLNRWDIFVNGNRLNVTLNGGRNWHTMRANIQASNIVDFEFTSANHWLSVGMANLSGARGNDTPVKRHTVYLCDCVVMTTECINIAPRRICPSVKEYIST